MASENIQFSRLASELTNNILNEFSGQFYETLFKSSHQQSTRVREATKKKLQINGLAIKKVGGGEGTGH